jgi:hypothetical protein
MRKAAHSGHGSGCKLSGRVTRETDMPYGQQSLTPALMVSRCNSK